jgi:hypothetical protein
VDGEATELPDDAQEHCAPEGAALGKLLVMGTAIR